MKPVPDKSKAADIIEYTAPSPIKPSTLERPPFDAPLVRLKSTISASLQKELYKKLEQKENGTLSIQSKVSDGVITAGTLCKNGGCKQVNGMYRLTETLTHSLGYRLML